MAISFLQSIVDGTNATEYTFSGANFGTASADRYITIGVTGRATAGGGLSSATIGGVTATIDIQVTNSSSNFTTAGFIKANVPTGTSGDVVVTFSAAQLRAGIGMWSLTELASATANDTATSTASPLSLGIDVDAGGYVLACGYSTDNASGGPASSWTELTERYDEDVEGATGSVHTGADTTSASTTTITPTCTFDESLVPAGVAVAYDVSAAGVTAVPLRRMLRGIGQ